MCMPWASTPRAASQLAISKFVTTTQPFALAISTASPTWSPWPWLTRTASTLMSAGLALAWMLPLRKGSTMILWPSASSSKQECPW